MTLWRIAAVAASVVAFAAFGWAAFLIFESAGPTAVTITGEPAPAAASTAHINATVFFGASNGRGLAATRVEVPLETHVAAQGEAILQAALADPPSGTMRVVPAGTRLRAFYVDSRGDAFVDLTSEVRSAHPGGSFGEALTVAALVNAVTTNLRAVRRVQLLVEGEEVETLAGHLDVSQPLGPDTSLVSKTDAIRTDSR
jgi:hypothetical protein